MGTLLVIATPIGNLEDISIRAIHSLFSVDILLCEDTRRTGILLQELKKRFGSLFLPDMREPKLMSYYDEVEFTRVPEIIALLGEGNHIGLVSDNGMPGISDPGFLLVKEARKRNIPVSVIPGSNAALTALVGSGLPTNTFTFLGFLPEKAGPRRKLLTKMNDANAILPTTYILYCAPHKLRQTLEDLQSTFGDITLVVARELTKVHEEFWRGTVEAALRHFTDPKGELTLLLSV